MRLAALLIYPTAVHLSIIMHAPVIQIIAIASLAAALLFNGLRKAGKFSWAIFLLIVALSIFAAYAEVAIYALYVPPIIIPLLLWGVFFHSLLPGQEPIVTDLGEKARGPLTPEMRRYTRYVTISWMIMFALIALWSAILPFIASDAVWSAFTNFINYAVVAASFFGEYLYRCIRFPEHNHPNFFQYLRIVINANIRK